MSYNMDIKSGLYFVNTGVCGGCMTCLQELDYDSTDELVAAVECGDVADEPFFSWEACERCNSGMGGNRYVAHGRESMDGPIIHMDICTDCVLELN